MRVGDFEEVAAQAIKSRRWPTERSLWTHLGDRLEGVEHPKLVVVEGSLRKLEVLLGLRPRWERLSLPRRRPSVIGHIGIVQPGLGKVQFEQAIAAGNNSAVQITQLLSVFRDAVLQVASPVVLVSP